MKKIHALLMMVILCTVSFVPLTAKAQSEKALEHRAEISYPIKFDKTPKPLREMFDNGERQKPARGGRDFEPGRPEPVGNQNRETIDPLAASGVGLTRQEGHDKRYEIA